MSPDCPALPPSDEVHLTDQLLNKCEKEQTNYDVQIGDGMDIVIVGENGKDPHRLNIVERIYSQGT